MKHVKPATEPVSKGKKIKITDLESFVSTHIYNPYKSKLDSEYQQLAAPIARNLDNAIYYLMNAPEWRDLVVKRLCKIDFYFPYYIQHEIVDYVDIKCEQMEQEGQ